MIVLIGINHNSAPVEVREKFVFCEKDIIKFTSFFKNKDWFKGLVVVSTCNRTEFYFELITQNDHDYYNEIINILTNYRKFDGNIQDFTYKHTNKEAAKHLFTVSSGLDSMALGEYQVVTQLKDAFDISKRNKIAGSANCRLFQQAFKASKRVRTSTKMNEGAVSVSYAAVELVSKKIKNIAEMPILAIGAGETGQLVIQSLKKKKCQFISVANRTYDKTLEVSKQLEVKPVFFENLDAELTKNDILLISTSSKKPIITKEQVENAMIDRKNKPLLMIDLSVPRNISAEVKTLENVSLFDVDDLRGVIEENYAKRKEKIQQAEQIIDSLVTEYMDWLSTRILQPMIQKLSENFKEINKKEIEGFQKNKVKIDYSKAIEYGDHITNKYVRLLIKKIKTVTDNGKKAEMIELVNELFELD